MLKKLHMKLGKKFQIAKTVFSQVLATTAILLKFRLALFSFGYVYFGISFRKSFPNV